MDLGMVLLNSELYTNDKPRLHAMSSHIIYSGSSFLWHYNILLHLLHFYLGTLEQYHRHAAFAHVGHQYFVHIRCFPYQPRKPILSTQLLLAGMHVFQT